MQDRMKPPAASALLGALLAAILMPAHLFAAGGPPRPDHVVVVVEENHSFDEILGSKEAPYINRLASSGALMARSFAVAHPSEPNYLALFSGSTQGVTSDACPVDFGKSPNLAAALLSKGFTFKAFSDSLPSRGSTTCRSGAYARKHNPWADWQEKGGFPAADNLPFTSFPAGPDYGSLPTVCWVIPNLDNDMHDGTIGDGDAWLQKNLGAYAQWCGSHNSLLILTWDEDDKETTANQILTVFYGAGVRAGKYDEVINHYSVLRTILEWFHLPAFNEAAKAAPVTDIFLPPASPQ
jgi:phosphatidylinositol-3-phosphatase